VHTGSECGSEIRGARSDEPKLRIQSKFHLFRYVVASTTQTIKDGVDVSSLLHRDDSELIFFIDPNQERFILVMEDTSSVWPVSIESTSFQKSVSFLE